jgi:hypothetical protein
VVLTLECCNGIGQQTCDSHWADATWNWGNCRRVPCFVKCNITDNPGTPVAINSVNTNIDNDCTRFDPVTLYKLGATYSDNEDVCGTAECGYVFGF